jgi:hypothetical protein
LSGPLTGAIHHTGKPRPPGSKEFTHAYLLLRWWANARRPRSVLPPARGSGGLPTGWSVYPHVNGDDKALHIARVDSEKAVAAHLALFADVYESTKPIEVIDGR